MVSCPAQFGGILRSLAIGLHNFRILLKPVISIAPEPVLTSHHLYTYAVTWITLYADDDKCREDGRSFMLCSASTSAGVLASLPACFIYTGGLPPSPSGNSLNSFINSSPVVCHTET